MSSDPGSGHASSEDLAAYLSRHLSQEDRAEVERHLAECQSCRDELAAAQDLLSRRKRPMQMGGALAVAAVAVAMVLVLRTPSSRLQPDENIPRSRGAVAAPAAISVVAPKEGTITGDSAIMFQWSDQRAAERYRITLMSEDGNVLWSAETKDTHVTLPSTVHLSSATQYLWYVDATRAAGDSVSSGPSSFRTR